MQLRAKFKITREVLFQLFQFRQSYQELIGAHLLHALEAELYPQPIVDLLIAAIAAIMAYPRPESQFQKMEVLCFN